MAKKNKTEQLEDLTEAYMEAVRKLFKDDDVELADYALTALQNVKQERIFRDSILDKLDSISIISLSQVLGF